VDAVEVLWRDWDYAELGSADPSKGLLLEGLPVRSTSVHFA